MKVCENCKALFWPKNETDYEGIFFHSFNSMLRREETAIGKTDRSVVRNQAYRKSAVSIRESHNERKNQEYSNPDIVKDRSNLNVHFKGCDGGYAEAFDRMVEDRNHKHTRAERGCKPDSDRTTGIYHVILV